MSYISYTHIHTHTHTHHTYTHTYTHIHTYTQTHTHTHTHTYTYTYTYTYRRGVCIEPNEELNPRLALRQCALVNAVVGVDNEKVSYFKVRYRTG
jgi:hypothetical protein